MYDNAFYKGSVDGTRSSASVIIPKLLTFFPHVRSVVDFGCGTGAWLKEFEMAGKEIQGYDFGVGVPDYLQIPVESFTFMDISNPLVIEKKFDLAICFEVAEHISDQNTEHLITSLTISADIIVFSAGIPGQGGKGHCNEQWPLYWQEKFKDKGFLCFDILRPLFWLDTRIYFWYRQNIFLYLKENIASNYPQITQAYSFHNYPLIHPELFYCYRKKNKEINLKKLG
jgi:SAM-dependent methyltransferase